MIDFAGADTVSEPWATGVGLYDPGEACTAGLDVGCCALEL